MTNFSCVDARFKFYNGKKFMTVEFAYGNSTWYVFDGEDESRTVHIKKIDPAKSKSPNRSEAEKILEEYLETIPLSSPNNK